MSIESAERYAEEVESDIEERDHVAKHHKKGQLEDLTLLRDVFRYLNPDEPISEEGRWDTAKVVRERIKELEEIERAG